MKSSSAEVEVKMYAFAGLAHPWGRSRPVAWSGDGGGSGNNKGGTKIILFTEIYMIMIEIHGMTNVSNYITQNSWLY